MANGYVTQTPEVQIHEGKGIMDDADIVEQNLTNLRSQTEGITSSMAFSGDASVRAMNTMETFVQNGLKAVQEIRERGQHQLNLGQTTIDAEAQRGQHFDFDLPVRV